MHKFYLARIAFLLVVYPWPIIGDTVNAANHATPQYILFLTADGFRSDYVEWYQPPHLQQLITEGVRVMHATNVFPTLTTPNMTSLVTGSYPRTTGIAANTQYVKELDKIVDRPRDNKAETISETLQKAGWTTAAVNYFMLQKRGTDFYLAPGYDDCEATTSAVLDVLKKKKARFIAAIYGITDHAGHNHGPRSAEVKNAVMEIDNAIGNLIRGLKEQGIYEKTLIVFSSDHGMSAYEKKEVEIEPADALKKAGFHVTASKEEINPKTEIIVLSFGVRIVYFRNLPPAREKKALAVLSAIKGAEVLDRKKLDALGCHNNRSGDVIVSPLSGYVMDHAGKNGGLHGQLSERNPILFFRGPGLKKNANVEGAQNIDVVPTLLSLVNVAPAATVDGRVISGALQKP
ncbi:MAG: alkaline phosphatase family protein [Verrucomicrobiota bacterium]